VRENEAKALIVGLGNPGQDYARTRHNIGFMVVDELARRAGVALRCGSGLYRAGEARLGDVYAILAEPLTFMNESGAAVCQLLRQYGISAAQLLVVHDDVDLPFGRLRLRPGGSAAGHRGLLSIIAALGTDRFARLRVGIGRPQEGSVRDYVLSPFTSEEGQVLPLLLDRACGAVMTFLREGVEKAMTICNSAKAQL